MQVSRPVRVFLMGVSQVSLIGTVTAAVLTDEPPAPTASEVLIELARHDLTPEVLCVAGFVPAQIGGFVGHATDTLTDHWGDVVAARVRVEGTRVQLASARAALAGPEDEAGLIAIALAEAELAAALSAAQTLDGQVRDALDDGMGSDAKALARTVRGNASRGLPVEYLTLSLADESWMELRHAFAHVRTVQEPEEPDQGIQQILNIYDSDPAVTAARSALALYGAQVGSAYLSSLLER